MMGYTSLPLKTTPLPQEAGKVSLEERIPSTYKGVNQEATAGLSNLSRPLGTITAGELLEWLLCETL